MKKLLVLSLLVLPLVLFAKLPKEVSQITVSLVNEKGMVVKTGKFNSQGSLTLDGVEDATYTIRLNNGNKHCELTKSKSGDHSTGLATGRRQHKPLSFVMGEQVGGSGLCGQTDHLRTNSKSNKLYENKSSSGDSDDIVNSKEYTDEWSTAVLVVNDNGKGSISFQLNMGNVRHKK